MKKFLCYTNFLRFQSLMAMLTQSLKNPLINNYENNLSVQTNVVDYSISPDWEVSKGSAAVAVSM